MIRRLRSALRGSLGMIERTVHRSLGAHWKGFTLGLVALGAGAPATVYLRTVILPERPAVAMAPGDTVVVYGPRQFNGTTGSGTTYVERFTIALQPGRKYELKLVNGVAGGNSNRVTSAVTKLNGFQVIGTTDLTSSIASVTKVVAVRQIDTLRVTVVGPAGSFVTATLSSLATSEFLVNGPTDYGIPSGTQKTHTFSFTKAASAGAPFRLYLTNGDTAGGLRVTNASVVLNGTMVVTTTEFTNAIGSLTKTVTLTATNNVTVSLKGSASRFVTLWFTATDTTAPVVAITNPPADSAARTSPIMVRGTISDASPTTVTVNGVQATVTNNTSFLASVPLSTQGNNLLTAIATDAGGRTSQATRNVIFDSQAPALTVTAPADNSATKNATVAVTGSFTDATAVTVRTNGTSLTVTGTSFSGNVALAMGANVLTTTATDAAGNATSVVRNVTRDTTPPALTVSAPAEGALVGGDSVTMSGTVTDQTAVTVATNGVSLVVTGTTFSGKEALAAGANTLTTVATDAAGNATTVVRHVSRDNTPPTLTVSAPLEGAITKADSIPVSGTASDANGVTVSTNGTALPVTGINFTGKVPVAVGANVLTTTATDGAGNITSVIRNVVRDTTPPVFGTGILPPLPYSTTTEDSVLVTGPVSDETAVTVTANGISLPVVSGTFSGKVPLNDGDNPIVIVATDAAGNTSTTERLIGKVSSVPPDPETVAPPLNPSVASTVGSATAFLYTGPNAIQTSVAPGTINPVRVAVIRGKVLSQSGAQLPSVKVQVIDHPEYGQTLSRADGKFDLAANGGGKLVLEFSKSGYLPAQRHVELPWSDYVEIDSLALVPLDTAATTINFTQPIEVARGTAVTDTSGTRQETLLFAQGTEVSVKLPNGSTQAITGPIKVRSTEYTVGPMGPAAMPAVLPPNSAYTYAVELTVDTAMALGATEVQFSQPVASYVENFMNLPVGHAVPVGSYNREQAKWIPELDGRVIKILAINGGMADVAVTTSGQPASAAQLAALGITDAERQTLATLYSVNETLWRTSHTHFTTFDKNLIFWIANQAVGLINGLLKRLLQPVLAALCPGSVIHCESQVLGEVLPIAGTPFSLHYMSDRVPGYTAESSIELQMSDATLPPPAAQLEDLVLNVSVAGQQTSRSFSPTPDLWHTYTWDGLDRFGRPVQGNQKITIERCYRYKPIAVTIVGVDGIRSFGSSNISSEFLTLNARPQTSSNLCHTWQGRIGAWYSPGQGLGGWNLSAAHSYDAGARTLYLGTGERRRADAIGNILVTAAGVGDSGFTGDGGPATSARLYNPPRVLLAPDGSLYISNTGRPRISKVSPDGIITTVAGTGSLCVPASNPTCGDGQPATSAPLRFPVGLALGPDGSLYIADKNNARVRRVTPEGIMTTFAGTGTDGYSGDGGPATAARLAAPTDVALGPDGSLYISDQNNFRVRKVSPAGIISTVAGNGTNGFFGGENGLATNTSVPFPAGIAVAPDGTLLINVSGHNRIRKVSPAGTITTVAGSLVGYAGDGGPATQARFRGLDGMALGPDGSIYVVDADNIRIRKIDNTGTIFTVAGNGLLACSPRVVTANCVTPNGDGGPATQASLHGPMGVALAPDGSIYIADASGDRVRKISPALPGIPATDMLIASESGDEVYRFDLAGRHLQTLDAKTGTALLTLARDAAGRITTLTDADDNVTTIERQANGTPTGILGPFGQRTVLTTDASGYLASMANPAGELVRLFSKNNGLLDSLVDPRGKAHRFSYSSLGLLRRDDDPAGGFSTLAHGQGTTIDTVDLTTGLGRKIRYRTQRMPNGNVMQIVTDPAGLLATTVTGADGSRSNETPDGTTSSFFVRGDPRFGMQAPVLQSATIRMPSGLTSTITGSHQATLSDPANPLSLVSKRDTLRVNGQVFTSVYDAATHRRTNTTPEGRESVSRTDQAGRTLSDRIVGLDSISYRYNSDGLLDQVRSGGRAWNYSYDASGRPKSTLDPLGRRDSLFYDNADRLIRRVMPGGREVLLAYDSSGNVTVVTPPGRPPHGFGYSAVNLSNSYTPPNVGLTTPATTYQYNTDKQLTRITRPDSIQVVFDYDTAGRPSAVTFDRGQLTYGYSATSGKLTSITAPGGNILTHTYDGALPNTVTWGGPVQGSIGVGYNNDLRVTSMTVNGASSIPFGYDRDGLLTTAGDLGIKRHAQHGLPERDSVGTINSVSSYSSRGALDGYTVTSGGSTLFQTNYIRDSLDRIIQLTETVQGATTVIAFAYDSAGRLQEVRRDGAVTATYEYDQNGNRLHLTMPNGTINGTYDAQDRLTSYGANSYTYGSNGELKSKTDATGATGYTYDAFGNLTAVTLPDATQITYIIDGLNRRIGKRVNGAIVQGLLYQDEFRPVAELNGTNQIVSRFVYGTKSNVPDYMIKGGEIYRMITDRLGSVRLVVKASDGSVAQRLNYDEFGRIVENTAAGFQPFGFAGGLVDDQTGLVRFGARDYDPNTGRWTGKDAIGFLAGASNLYSYVGNNPINYKDPLGLWDIFAIIDVDLVGVFGVEVSAGFVIDWDCLGESGYFFAAGPAGGANVGIGIGAGWVQRELEGSGVGIDLNLGAFSPSLLFDDEGLNGGALTFGPGVGGSLSGTKTWNLKIPGHPELTVPCPQRWF